MILVRSAGVRTYRTRQWDATLQHEIDQLEYLFFDVLLTVHLSIILVINQLNAQILILL